ncbi:hypothetical protein [Cohnella terricola]|uniref:Uncharacterized protein n=1 Tax=Cohnella terricola TaxID=1289167 RepID=A0A559JN16_9BACL|nr:hypothetical protein [Cohnella terricola]TVY01263.1 hypothetical protein FPZ45_08935 [Cohnella terricola]
MLRGVGLAIVAFYDNRRVLHGVGLAIVAFYDNGRGLRGVGLAIVAFYDNGRVLRGIGLAIVTFYDNGRGLRVQHVGGLNRACTLEGRFLFSIMHFAAVIFAKQTKTARTVVPAVFVNMRALDAPSYLPALFVRLI